LKKPALYALKTLNLKLTLPSLAPKLCLALNLSKLLLSSIFLGPPNLLTHLFKLLAQVLWDVWHSNHLGRTNPLAKGFRQEALNEHFIEGLQKRRANLLKSALYSL
jgi:hypothetical protein